MERLLVAVVLGIAGWAASAVGCSVPLEPNRASFSTTVYVGSSGPFRFLVDTGTTTTVIDRSVASRIGVHPDRAIAAVSTNGVVEVQEAKVHGLRAGTVSIAAADVLIADLPPFANHGRIDGILGMSFFAGRSILIDIRHRCLELDVAPGRGVALEAHEVVGRVAIETEGLNFIVDSGASLLVLTSSRARALAMQNGEAKLTSASGTQRTFAATIPRLRLGGLTLSDITAAVAIRNDPREDGLLPITLFDSVYISADRNEVVLR